jgi:hypothetical protein
MSQAPPVEAIAIAAALLLLALSVLFARAVRGTGPSRARRILVSPLIFVFGTLFVFGTPWLFDGSASISLPGVGRGLFWLFLIGLAGVLLLEGTTTLFAPERTAGWLGGGIFIALFLTMCGVAMVTGPLFFAFDPLSLLLPAPIAIATVIGWWSYLPRPEGMEEADGELTEVFE